MSRTVNDFIDSAMRKEISFLLATFPINQVELFNRAWPDGINNIGYSNLRAALALCFRTEAANEAKRRVTSPQHHAQD